MKNRQKSTIKKNTRQHFVDAHTSHFEENEMEVAQEFFEEDFVKSLDHTSTLADNLTQKLKNDFQN